MTSPDHYPAGQVFFHQILGELGHLMHDASIPSTIQEQLAQLAATIRSGAAPILEALALASPRIAAHIGRHDLGSFLRSQRAEMHALLCVAPAAHIVPLRTIIHRSGWSVRSCTRPGDVRGLVAGQPADLILVAPPPSRSGKWWRVILDEVPLDATSRLVHLEDEPELSA